MKKIIPAAAMIFLLMLALTGCNQYPKQPVTTVDTGTVELKRHPRNIILMIGDGMGLTQITAGLYRNGNRLNLERFPIVGLQKTYSGNDLITDSAAGATAFSAGVKTYNNAIGVDMDTNAVRTILEEAEEKGLATGLVATSSVTHATPAAFIAHVNSRSRIEEIATFFLKTDVDLIIGGGERFFLQRKNDDRNLISELENKGYLVSGYRREPLSELVLDFDRNLAYFTAEGEPETVAKGRDYLLTASRLAPIFLKKRSSKGFFLMIEGSQIDWGGHAKDSEYIISEMIEFDKAIGTVLDFAKEDGQTLVIVTADHETGGYSINMGSSMDTIVGAFTTDYHTAVLIPVFAFGPGSELFGGMYENTAIYEKMRQAFGFEKEQ